MRTVKALRVGWSVLFVLAACSQSEEKRERPSATATPTGDPHNNVSEVRQIDTTGWTSGRLEKKGDSIAVLRNVRVGSHEGFERMVFEFNGRLSGYAIEYIDRPVRACGSGDVVELPGDAWLSIRLEPAAAHTEEGAPTVAARDMAPGSENIKRLKLICDFEAIVEWVAAVDFPGRFRVVELAQPGRLVVDVRKRE